VTIAKSAIAAASIGASLSMSTPIHVAVGVLLEQQQGTWRCLIACRPHDTVLPGYWELPGGKVEPGETGAQCVVREFREELDLGVEVNGPVPGERVAHQYDHGHVHIDAFLCGGRRGEPKNLAVTEHRWVTADELGDYQFPPANDELIRRVVIEMQSRDEGVAARR
jgi:mutator protein MutT